MADEAATPARDPGHVVEDQSEVLAFLARPETHGLDAPPVRIDTHGAVVFLAGPDAYKLKRAVRFPFMDFSTLALRQAATAAEVAVNAPGAPGLYRGVVAITRAADGGLERGGEGPVVDVVVHMRRFDESLTLDKVADRGDLTPAMLDTLVRRIVEAHARAPLRPAAASPTSLARYLAQNREAFAESPDLFPPARAAALSDRMEALLSRLWPLLVTRGEAGLVRCCHGDLHLRNVVLIDGAPILFDAIEFDDGIATCDVLYDLAYLIMDLIDLSLVAEANRVLNRYLSATDDRNLDGLAALPLFLSLRATIRAKVTAAALPSLTPEKRERAAAEARTYFALAETVLADTPPVLVAVGGLSGSGKSTVSAALAPRLGKAPGAVHLRSDVIRKTLAGVAETAPLPPESYTKAASDAVYTALRDRAGRVLAAGASVVVDAVHARPEERDAIAAVAAAHSARFRGVWLDAPVETRMARVDTRVGDASDANAEVARKQTDYDLGPMTWLSLDATGAPATLAYAVLKRLDS
ncbi:AAA family ATPase [Mongoliimonas terrestris]|uniref:bifunctional aminoglycoside phosphotransferase/ATP-binding protein n=1 Tax=Mongoliimonas terrestris TaxID=1709001 RepID=UPI00094968C6|nr:bifunctional aminoglycoside phosphotransferase/ATP-binding protein [Mongoliimonas terrestris]